MLPAGSPSPGAGEEDSTITSMNDQPDPKERDELKLQSTFTSGFIAFKKYQQFVSL